MSDKPRYRLSTKLTGLRPRRAGARLDAGPQPKPPSIPIPEKGRYRLANGSVVCISEIRYGFAGGHIEDTKAIFTYSVATGETSVKSYRAVEYLGPLRAAGEHGASAMTTGHPEAKSPSSQHDRGLSKKERRQDA